MKYGGDSAGILPVVKEEPEKEDRMGGRGETQKKTGNYWARLPQKKQTLRKGHHVFQKINQTVQEGGDFSQIGGKR